MSHEVVSTPGVLSGHEDSMLPFLYALGVKSTVPCPAMLMSQVPRQLCNFKSLLLSRKSPALCLLSPFANTDQLASQPDEFEQNHVLILKFKDALPGTVDTSGEDWLYPSCIMQTGGGKPGSCEDQPCLSTWSAAPSPQPLVSEAVLPLLQQHLCGYPPQWSQPSLCLQVRRRCIPQISSAQLTLLG